MMASRGRPPGLPKVPGSGRKRGSLDKSARLLLTDRMANDIWKTYQRLGPDWLFTVAKERPDLFINQCLSRLLPPAIRDDGGDIQVNQVNIGGMSEFEAARRVAYALARGVYPDPSLAPVIDITPVETVEMTPQQACSWQDPTPPYTPPGETPVEDPQRSQWAASLPLSDQERADNALIRETKQASISSYQGSPGEQGHSTQRQSVVRDPRAAQRDRLIAARRRKDLL